MFTKFIIVNNICEQSVITEDINKYIEFLAKKGLSPRSINRKISTVKNYYNFLISLFEVLIEGLKFKDFWVYISCSQKWKIMISNSEVKTSSFLEN